MLRAAGIVAVAAITLGIAVASSRAETSHYYVYCANGRIEVDGRSPEQMRIARGSDVCVLGTFGFLSSAQDFARQNFGGEGRPCTCGR